MDTLSSLSTLSKWGTPLYRTAALRRIEADYAHLPLMQRAGAAAAALAVNIALNRRILILAGSGNNGGDAVEAARLLRQQGYEITLVFSGTQAPNAQSVPPDAWVAHQRYQAEGGQYQSGIPSSEGAADYGLIIDGLLGIGLKSNPAPHLAKLITIANQLADSKPLPLLAIDCPTGLNSDTGVAAADCIRATHTITFIAAKQGLYTLDGPDYCGEIHLASLDLPLAGSGDGVLIGDLASRLSLPARRKNSHKGSYGRVAVIGGSAGMAGAALLAGRAALKLGAGCVYVGMCDAAMPRVDFAQPELMLRSVDSLWAASESESASAVSGSNFNHLNGALNLEVDALACGPGLGNSAEAEALLAKVLRLNLPIILDADALNIVGRSAQIQQLLVERAQISGEGDIDSEGEIQADRSTETDASEAKHPLITLMTPHPKEAARLLACALSDIQHDRITAALAIAKKFGAYVALKGCGTVLAMPDGTWAVNTSGNPGLASAGSGDVLTGISLAVLAQHQQFGIAPALVLPLAVYIHAAAADVLANRPAYYRLRTGVSGSATRAANQLARQGEIGLTASEIIDAARFVLNQCIDYTRR